MNKKPFCVVPFVEGFSGFPGRYRNCCSASPQIQSQPEHTFAQWWNSTELKEFRDKLLDNRWPTECQRCQLQELGNQNSFRLAVNQVTDQIQPWPQRWNLSFGNVCNLGCWTCDEHFSSVIAHHKKKINILPHDFVDPNKIFLQQWDNLKQDILKSYQHYETVTLTLLGGEPMFIKHIPEFLTELGNLGLAPRTRLEFHTNATLFNLQLFQQYYWNYICTFLSLDAVGAKAEWLRYGCNWQDVEQNVEKFKAVSDYVEVHCTLSVLNLSDLPNLKVFCEKQNLPLKISVLADPAYMSLSNWSGPSHELASRDYLREHGFEQYYDLVGQTAMHDSKNMLRNFIKQFDTIRISLKDIDNKLFQVLNL
jgi:organic radical activating enzyme